MKMILLEPGELSQLIRDAVREEIQAMAPKPAAESKLIYGISGLASFLQCSHTTAQKIKNGLKPDCFFQSGRKLAFRTDRILDLRKKG